MYLGEEEFFTSVFQFLQLLYEHFLMKHPKPKSTGLHKDCDSSSRYHWNETRYRRTAAYPSDWYIDPISSSHYTVHIFICT